MDTKRCSVWLPGTQVGYFSPSSANGGSGLPILNALRLWLEFLHLPCIFCTFFLYYYFYSPCPWHPEDALATEERCGAAQPFPGSWGATRSLQVGALPCVDKNSKKADEDCSVLAKLCLAPETEGQQAVTGQA